MKHAKLEDIAYFRADKLSFIDHIIIITFEFQEEKGRIKLFYLKDTSKLISVLYYEKFISLTRN